MSCYLQAMLDPCSSLFNTRSFCDPIALCLFLQMRVYALFALTGSYHSLAVHAVQTFLGLSAMPEDPRSYEALACVPASCSNCNTIGSSDGHAQQQSPDMALLGNIQPVGVVLDLVSSGSGAAADSQKIWHAGSHLAPPAVTGTILETLKQAAEQGCRGAVVAQNAVQLCADGLVFELVFKS